MDDGAIDVLIADEVTGQYLSPVDTRVPFGQFRDGRIRMVILNDRHPFEIEGEAHRMEVQRADMERVPLDVCVQLPFRIGPQRFIDEQAGDTYYTNRMSGIAIVQHHRRRDGRVSE